MLDPFLSTIKDENNMKNTLAFVVVAGLALAISATADAQQTPKYSADVPKSIQTPDVVKTERLGDLNFFDGLPSEETANKVTTISMVRVAWTRS